MVACCDEAKTKADTRDVTVIYQSRCYLPSAYFILLTMVLPILNTSEESIFFIETF